MTATPHDVLRQHSLYELADGAENPVLAPDYTQQSAYWSSVLSTPTMREFTKWPCPVMCGFQPEPELPFGIMRVVVLIHRHGKGPYAAVSSVIKAQIRDCQCLSECSHAACTA